MARQEVDPTVIHEMLDDILPDTRRALKQALDAVENLHGAAEERSGLRDLTEYDELSGNVEDAFVVLTNIQRDLEARDDRSDN